MEGKTTVVSNLGIALAEIGNKVLLIDGDLRRPRLHKVFDQTNSWGLSDVLREKNAIEELPLDALVKKTAVPRLSLLPSGTSTDNIFGLLCSGRMARLLPRFRQEFDYVLVDAPPCLEFADARIMARYAERLLLVVRADYTDRKTAQAAVQRLLLDGIPVMGVIFNYWDPTHSDLYGYAALPVRNWCEYTEKFSRWTCPALRRARLVEVVPSPARGVSTPRSSPGLSLRSNFAWILTGNVVYAACQWGAIVALAKLGSSFMIGQFSLGLAIATPVLMFTNLHLRAVQATDARRLSSFGEYLRLRTAMTLCGLAVIGGIAWFGNYQRQTTMVILAVALAKGIETLSDIHYGLFQLNDRLDQIGRSMMLRGGLSVAALSTGLYATHNVLWGCVGLALVWLGRPALLRRSAGSPLCGAFRDGR